MFSIIFCLHMFVFFIVFPYPWFLISWALWSEKILDMISIFLNLPRFVLWPSMWSVLENIPWALEKNVFLWLLYGILHKYQWRQSGLTSFKACVSLLIINDLCIDESGVLTHCSEKAMAPHSSTLTWKIPWMEEPGGLQSMGSLGQTRLSDFTFSFHFHALEKEMATHSGVFAWRIPGTGEPGGLPSMGSLRAGHDWSDLAAAAAGL